LSRRTAVVLFHRDLRVHDHPALALACATTDQVVPLFVIDPRLPSDANRRRFLLQSLADLRHALRERGGDLLIRTGDPAVEAVRVAREVTALTIVTSEDVSRFAKSRQQRLARACERERLKLTLTPGVTVVPAGALRPSTGGDHYRVFTPYWRAWQAASWRDAVDAPGRIELPDGVAGDDPEPFFARPGAGSDTAGSRLSEQAAAGGEVAAREALRRFRDRAERYPDGHDDLAGDVTSRLSPYLHFGCLSPLALATTSGLPEAFLRQLCWRDFYCQVLASFGELATRAYRASAVEEWGADDQALQAWQSGQTGVPIVDAGMRQLAAQGWLHNRARLITAGYLTKTLRLDWRAGADWYMRWLIDADTANNYGNWQWVAGTGNDTRPYRRFNPIRQAQRFDPQGDYVRRWVPELAELPAAAIHQPWLLPAVDRPAYPPPLALSRPSEKSPF
jgi:deoxyribodipyrimidine photo-lyase